MKHALIIAPLLCALALQAYAGQDETNYCNDPEAAAHWAKLLREAPGDDVLVRLGLCQMVEAGVIDLDRGARIFEQARQQAIIEWRREPGRPEREL